MLTDDALAEAAAVVGISGERPANASPTVVDTTAAVSTVPAETDALEVPGEAPPAAADADPLDVLALSKLIPLVP